MDNKKITNSKKTESIDYTFANYLIKIGIRSIDYSYDDETLFNNIEYFRRCQKAGLSAYKALLYLYDFIDGKYDIWDINYKY